MKLILFVSLLFTAFIIDGQKSKDDPLFTGVITTTNNWKNFLRFIPQHNSPVIDQGVTVEGHPEKDFLGNPVIGEPDRGAFEVGK